MATKLDDFEFKGPRGWGYPWEQWFDGSIWVCKRGEDFTVSVQGFGSAVYNAAKKKNLRVRVSQNSAEGTVTFQAMPQP